MNYSVIKIKTRFHKFQLIVFRIGKRVQCLIGFRFMAFITNKITEFGVEFDRLFKLSILFYRHLHSDFMGTTSAFVPRRTRQIIKCARLD